MTEVHHVITRRGRPRDADAPASTRPTSQDLTWAAGIFGAAPGRIERATNLELILRLQRYERDKDTLTSFLAFFGGQLKPVAPDGRTGEARWEWSCRGARSIGVVLTFYCRLNPHRRAQIRMELEKDAILANVQRPTMTVVRSQRTEEAVIVPKTDITVPPDYEPEIMFLYVTEGDSPVVYGLPDVPTMERFVADARISNLNIVQQIELTVTLAVKPS